MRFINLCKVNKIKETAGVVDLIELKPKMTLNHHIINNLYKTFNMIKIFKQEIIIQKWRRGRNLKGNCNFFKVLKILIKIESIWIWMTIKFKVVKPLITF